MSAAQDYHDIPGTYVLDGAHSRKGYPLNKFCMSLNQSTNRDAFRADAEAYMKKFALSDEQKDAIRKRDFLRMLQLGGNIYYTFKIAIFDGLSMQDVGAQMSGLSVECFKRALMDGGRSGCDG